MENKSIRRFVRQVTKEHQYLHAFSANCQVPSLSFNITNFLLFQKEGGMPQVREGGQRRQSTKAWRAAVSDAVAGDDFPRVYGCGGFGMRMEGREASRQSPDPELYPLQGDGVRWTPARVRAAPALPVAARLGFVRRLCEMGSLLGLRMPSSLAAPLVGASAGRMAPVVTAAGFAVAPRFGYVVLTASASVILTQWQMFQVAAQRKRSGIKYPKLYEDAENSVFNCYQRAHQNTLESYPAFLALLTLAGLAYPITASAFGMLWVVGRVVYSLGYYTGDPPKRNRGAFHNFGLWGLLITSIVFGVRTVMPLLSG